MSDDPLLFTREGSIARLTLNRPDMGNAINIPLAKALMEAAIECDENPGIRCVVLTGAGRMFCAGGDIGGFVGAGDAVSFYLKEITAYLHMAISRLSRMPKPMVTLINGATAGAGVSLGILGDIALAARSAHFTMAYTAIGLSPDGGATWLLPRLIGLRRAQEMALTNKRVSAEEAAGIGLITRVVEDDALAAEGQAVAEALAASATGALGRTRNLLAASYSATLESHLEAEVRAIADCGRGAEAKEGCSAFLAKRRPNFMS